VCPKKKVRSIYQGGRVVNHRSNDIVKIATPVPCYFHHLSGFVHAHHNFGGVLGEEKYFSKVTDVIILHFPRRKYSRSMLQHHMLPIVLCRHDITCTLSAEIWNALKCTEAVNPGDCLWTPIFTCPTGMAKALTGRL